MEFLEMNTGESRKSLNISQMKYLAWKIKQQGTLKNESWERFKVGKDSDMRKMGWVKILANLSPFISLT